ncbi:hypothetical protein ES703_113305 [subsurface metagenome]
MHTAAIAPANMTIPIITGSCSIMVFHLYSSCLTPPSLLMERDTRLTANILCACSTVPRSHVTRYLVGLSLRIETLFSCIVCGDGFKSRQGLAGHMNSHRDVEFMDVHVRVPKDVGKKFMGVVRKHKTTSCHLIYTVMKAIIKGDETGMVDLAAKNPLIVHMTSIFGGAPRGSRKYDLIPIPYGNLEEALRCDHLRHREFEVGRLGWCSKCGRYVTPSNCLGCVERGKKGPPQF